MTHGSQSHAACAGRKRLAQQMAAWGYTPSQRQEYLDDRDTGRLGWKDVASDHERWLRSENARIADMVEDAARQARRAAEAEERRVINEAHAKQQAEDREKAVAQARMTVDELYAKRLADEERVREERRAAYAASSATQYQIDEATRRAARELGCAAYESIVIHAVYLHVILRQEWHAALHAARLAPPNFWWDPAPMSNEEHEARRVLGQHGRP